MHVSLPALRPPALGGLLFYSVGPLIAVIAAVRRSPSAIVCQSPLEGLGAVLAVRLLPRSRRPPVQIEVHGDWRAAPRLYGSRARHLIAPLSDRLCGWALRRADRLHVVSEAMATQARQAGYGGPMDMHVEFADYSPFLEDDPIPFPAHPRVVFVGALEFTKGVDVLLDAWPVVLAQVPGAELVIAGDGTMDTALRRRVQPARDIQKRGVRRARSSTSAASDTGRLMVPGPPLPFRGASVGRARGDGPRPPGGRKCSRWPTRGSR